LRHRFHDLVAARRLRTEVLVYKTDADRGPRLRKANALKLA